MPRSPYLSDELNRVVEASDDPNQTVNVRSLKPGQVVEITFDSGNRKKIGFSFRIARIEVASPGGMGVDACGPLTEINLREDDLKYLKKKGINPRPGIEVKVGDACTWNPSAPLGATMVQFGHITAGRWLIWEIGVMDGWCLDLPVKSIKIKPAK